MVTINCTINSSYLGAILFVFHNHRLTTELQAVNIKCYETLLDIKNISVNKHY